MNRALLLFVAALAAVTLACAVSGGGQSTPRLAQEAYFTCVTATPVPTQAILIGTATPAAGTTPLPGATPGAPVYAYTTPVPTETPYYRVESFYLEQPVHVEGVIISLAEGRLAGDNGDGTAVYRATFQFTNYIGDGQIIPLSRLAFVRRVAAPDGRVLVGRWTASAEPVAESENRPVSYGETRKVTLDFTVPRGEVREIGLATGWVSNLEGGVPIWFVVAPDPVACPHGFAGWTEAGPPPTPTPAILGLSGQIAQGGGGPGVCGWPTSGILMRGFGCSAFQTGISDPMGCPAAAPYFHNGLDISAGAGTTVVAPVSGVARVGQDDLRGNYISVQNGSERHDLLHLSAQHVTDSQQVTAGEPVGAVGSTGFSSGPHLHWTIRQYGVAIDPQSWTGCS